MRAATPRARLIAAIHAARTAASLDEEAYRGLLAAHTGGKRSASDCSDDELRQVLTRLNRASGRPFRPSGNPEVRLIYKLWSELRALGALEVPTKGALRSFCGRMAGTSGKVATDPEFLDNRQRRSVIEALKAMLSRAKEAR